VEKSIECPMEMSECRVSAFFPLMGAPLNQTDGSCDFEEINLCQNNPIITKTMKRVWYENIS